MENILKLIGIIVIAIGIVFVYDARKLSGKFFGTGDANDATKTFKIVGFFVAVIGSVLVLI